MIVNPRVKYCITVAHLIGYSWLYCIRERFSNFFRCDAFRKVCWRLRRISNKMSIKGHKFYLLMKQQSKYASDVWAFLISLLSRILEKFVKLPPAFTY